MIPASQGAPDRDEACDDEGYFRFSEADALSFDYLPPETYALGPQYAAVCRDDSIAAYGQEFIVFNATLIVGFSAGERVLWHEGPPEGVFQGEIDGHTAVVVVGSPNSVGASAFGRSWIAIATAKGAISVTAEYLALEDALKIAQGIRCDDC